MKKKFKSLLGILLVLVLTFSLAGCGEMTDEERIVGEWTAEIDFTEVMESELAIVKAGNPDIADALVYSPIVLQLNAEFTSDGDWILAFDGAQAKEAFGIFAEEIASALHDYIINVQGATEEDIVEVFGGELEEVLREEMDLDALAETLSEPTMGEYEIADGKIYTAEEEEFFTYEFQDDDTLVFQEVGGTSIGAFPTFMMPMTLERR